MAFPILNPPYPQPLPTFALALMLSGCSLPFGGDIGSTGLSKEEFEQYAEEVFRFQNRMTSEVMMLTATDDAADMKAILKAEQHMQEVCGPLNEYVSRDIDGLSTGLLLRRRVVKTTLDCDHAAHELKALLDQ